MNAETGEYAWHFQTSAPGLQTENNHILIADLVIDGEKRHVAMTAPKNGFFYVLDAKTGKLVSAKPLAKLAWANSIDLKTGRADEVPPSAGGGKQWTVHNWWPMSYSALTGLVYVPATDRKSASNTAVESGEWMHGTEGRLIGWDPVASPPAGRCRSPSQPTAASSLPPAIWFSRDRARENLPPTPPTAGKKFGQFKPARPSNRFR